MEQECNPAAVSLPQREGQKVDFSLGVTLLEVVYLCKVPAHTSWLPTNGLFNVTMTLQVPYVFSWWKGEHLISGSLRRRVWQLMEKWGSQGVGDPHPEWVPTDFRCP